MKRQWAAIILTAALALAGCSGNEAGSDTATATDPSSADTSAAAKEETTTAREASGTEEREPVTLRFSWWGGDERLAATLKVIEQFQEKYPHITVEAEYGSSDGYNDKLATQLAAGTEPDIIQIEPGNMALLASDETNYFLDLKEAGFDFSLFGDRERYCSHHG